MKYLAQIIHFLYLITPQLCLTLTQCVMSAAPSDASGHYGLAVSEMVVMMT